MKMVESGPADRLWQKRHVDIPADLRNFRMIIRWCRSLVCPVFEIHRPFVGPNRWI